MNQSYYKTNTHKTEHWFYVRRRSGHHTLILLKPWVDLRCSNSVNSACSISGARRVTHGEYPVTSHERERTWFD